MLISSQSFALKNSFMFAIMIHESGSFIQNPTSLLSVSKTLFSIFSSHSILSLNSHSNLTTFLYSIHLLLIMFVSILLLIIYPYNIYS